MPSKFFVCPTCNKRCSKPSGLERHILSKHAVPQALQPPQPSPVDAPDAGPDFNPPGPSNPSPDVSSRRSPRRSPAGSPIRTPRTPMPSANSNPHRLKIDVHPIIDGTPCDVEGNDLDPGAAPAPEANIEPDNPFAPFDSRAKFEFGEFLYTEEEMSGGKMDKLFALLAALYPQENPPFSDHKELYATIDAIKQGEVPWNSFSVQYDGAKPQTGPIPTWMDDTYEVWFRDPLKVMENQIGNPEFKEKIDVAPKRVWHKGKRRYKNMMSGNWVWEQADKIALDPETHGSMFVPVILGSDKTTVSVATGQHDYYPLYASAGNVHNSTRRAHKNALTLVGFLAIPKTSQEFADKADFRKFRRQLFHASLENILSSLRPHMTTPRITKCADGHYRRVIYGLGPYIADYPEQALLACVVQGWCAKCLAPPDDLDRPNTAPRAHTHTDALVNCPDGVIGLKELWDSYGIVGDLIPFTMNFPRADIHELLAPDLLHQVIKGTFKDHIVDWVTQYIKESNTKAAADKILADIDRRISITPSFPGLRHFHQGRGFKQWTGNDSKGLMKVYLPAIAGHVPKQMVQAVAALIDFCYLVRRDVIDEDTLQQIQNSLQRFHQHREIFRELGVRPDGFSLPRQHSLVHYLFLITQFGAPNGLCSSITESKHIKAVKRPYRRSSRNNPLGQMLVTNQRIDKLAAARTNFSARGLLHGPNLTGSALQELLSRFPNQEVDPLAIQRSTQLPPPQTRSSVVAREDDDDDTGVIDDEVQEPESLSEVTLSKTYVRKLPRNVFALAPEVKQRNLPLLIQRFLYKQLHPDSDLDPAQIPQNDLPLIPQHHSIYIHNSIRAVFYAPSDLSGLGGLKHERVRSTHSWYRGPPRRDCVFIGNSDAPDAAGMQGLLVARALLFFSFKVGQVVYPCALVHWFSVVGDTPDDETGMWLVEPDYRGSTPSLEVIHLDTILRGAHLAGVAGPHFLPTSRQLTFSRTLDAFRTFYVNNSHNLVHPHNPQPTQIYYSVKVSKPVKQPKGLKSENKGPKKGPKT